LSNLEINTIQNNLSTQVNFGNLTKSQQSCRNIMELLKKYEDTQSKRFEIMNLGASRSLDTDCEKVQQDLVGYLLKDGINKADFQKVLSGEEYSELDDLFRSNNNTLDNSAVLKYLAEVLPSKDINAFDSVA